MYFYYSTCRNVKRVVKEEEGVKVYKYLRQYGIIALNFSYLVAVAVVIPIGVYTISPLFISNSVNEPLPTTAAITSNNSASHEYRKFISMNEQNRMNAAKQMNQRDKNMVTIGAGQINNTINQNTIAPHTTKEQQQKVQGSAATTTASSKIRTGSFIGAGDGFHNAQGLAKVISLGDGNSVLRLENFKSTNGPNVHIYLSTDKSALNFIDFNNGNQNYNIPDGTDLSKYIMVLIWCKDFSVLFGSGVKVTHEDTIA
jgi:uncharacterized protein with FMN-binding domain